MRPTGWALLAVGASACATLPVSEPDEWLAYPGGDASPTPHSPGEAAVALAQGWVGARTLPALRPWGLPDDCTGLVRLAYAPLGIALLGAEALATDNGVTAIYRHAVAAHALHRQTPAPGDLVFFAETYDRNHDGKRNDGLTHVGLVERVEPSGVVVFLHRVTSGVERSRLFLQRPGQSRGPSGDVWNDVLRAARGRSRAYLTGELFAAYASAAALAAGVPVGPLAQGGSP